MISLKVLVDKEKNRVIFAESYEDFTNVLFSFLTLPMGTIIRLISDQPPTAEIGCMTNLYESIKNLEIKFFQTEACKTMLLYPRSSAAAHCQRLKLQIDNSGQLGYFLCYKEGVNYCSHSAHKLLSLYRNAVCLCGRRMDCEMQLSGHDKGVFVNDVARFIVSDELQVKPSSIEASLTALSKLGITDGSTIEECNIDIGVDEVLTLLKFSLVSKTPLTETLLKHNLEPDLAKEDFDEGSYIKSRIEEPASDVKGKISVKLIVSKSKKMVCYAEACADFVDLLFSFLTLPLGYISKEMHSSSSKCSINHLYNSVQELDAEKYLKSDKQKTMLVNPRLAPGFSYENHPLGTEEDLHPPYYFTRERDVNNNYLTTLTSDRNFYHSGTTFLGTATLTVKNPKSPGGGFMREPAMFTVTDNLIITPISQISSLLLLKKLKVPFSDIEVRVVQVGSKEASRLLVTSFMTKSALTNAFLRGSNPKVKDEVAIL